MTSHHTNNTFKHLPKENSFYPKQLAASRWAPGGINRRISNNRDLNNKIMKDKMAATDGSASGAQGLTNPQMVKAHAESSQVGTKTMNNVTKAEGEKQNSNENTTLMLTQPIQGTIKRESPLTTRNIPSPKSHHISQGISKYENPVHTQYNIPEQKSRRIIGPLSEEEQTVKMENPFFDPKKHKGLSSSRWARE